MPCSYARQSVVDAGRPPSGDGSYRVSQRLVLLFSVFFVTNNLLAADNPLTRLAGEFCLECHSGDQPEGDLRLDSLTGPFFADGDRLEKLIDVLDGKQMPPSEHEQPSDQQRREVVRYLKQRFQQQEVSATLKRLTREEYTNTINDLFGSHFDLTELLPPDPAGEGFNKWGEVQRMSPYQVESYLRTARFVADRLLIDERPVEHVWEFGLDHFNGSGRGDFKSDTAFVLSTHYPWRSNLHFFRTAERKEIFRIPEFGRYRLEADVTVRNSKKTQTIGVSTGDPRYPTNFKKIARVVLPADGDSISVDLTLTAGTYLSFTYESAATWNVGKKPEDYKGPQVAFSKVRIIGPIVETWPTDAERLIFADGQDSSLTVDTAHRFTERVIGLLLNRSLTKGDVNDLQRLTLQKLEATGNTKAAARTLLTALLSSPHFIYKRESANLDGTELAYRLSYFLWNSAPDDELLRLARSGELNSTATLADQVERMLADPRSDRFCADFTRQWLQTDKIDDIGPDDRVHNKKKVTFMKIRELAKEPRAFFKEILQHNLSMSNFIDSDFAMVNDETAEFYGYKKVSGRAFQRVSIPKESERGGLVAQAGLLKLTSSKFATSPILRGTWILKNIYGRKLNPPPDLVFDEPDIRGATTVKEMIEKHKNSVTCNRCHARIDPLGLALEHYDEMGLWRDEYRHVEMMSLENKNTTVEHRAAPIDSHATLPDGRSVGSLSELKAVLMEDRVEVIKGIMAKLASYALGREIGIRDEAMIDEIYEQVADSDYSLRAAIHAIVAHDSFGRR